MGMAPMAYVLWTKILKHNPNNPRWFDRDRFVLSNGHACALLYSLLYLTGYDDWTMDDLKKFRQLGSKTAGHPESIYPGVEVTTGPLGQGISNAVGLAIAEKHLAAVYNREGFPVVNHKVWVFCGDGCLQEGVSSEAGSLAGHLGLGNLVVLYDDNLITIDGSTNLSFTEDVLKRYEAYGWNTITVEDGDRNVASIEAAIHKAQQVTDRPTMIKVRTTIGVDTAVANTHKAHGSPLGDKEVAALKTKYGMDPNQFFVVPEDVLNEFRASKEKGRELEKAWHQLYQQYAAKYPELAAELQRRIDGKLPDNWKSVLPSWKPEDPKMATRQHSEIVLNKLAEKIPEIVGGSADLTPSTLTFLKCSKDFQKNSYDGRHFRYGVREHGMASLMNGMAAHGAVIPYGATFLNFIQYALGAVRLSAVSELRTIYIMTHDSIGLGEDGPTHQPIETLPLLRAMPQLVLLRPGDGNEVAGAYAAALEETHHPSVIALSRQPVPSALPGTSADKVSKGAYVIVDPADGAKPDLIITGTGTELHLATGAAAKLTDKKVRVVSFPSWQLFERQPEDYRRSVFLDGVPVLSVEAASTFGWSKYAHASVGIDSFGASGPLQEVLNKFGFSVDNVTEKARKLLDFIGSHPAPSKLQKPF
jgi:transketolase